MNRQTTFPKLAYEVSDLAPITSFECPDCEGRGGWLATVRVSGEAMDADQREVICETCNGLGAVETVALCPYCEEPLLGCLCERCETAYSLYGLTAECLSDPLKGAGE